MSTINERLEHLKKTLHPAEKLNIITQCEIIAEAMAPGGLYEENREGLAIFLEISPSLVYQMNRIYHVMIPELKEYFRETDYQCHTTYDKASLSPRAQQKYLENIRLLEDNSLKQSKTGVEE